MNKEKSTDKSILYRNNVYICFNILKSTFMFGNKSRYSHSDWIEFKKYFGIRNSDISKVIGIDDQSVRNATAPSKNKLPMWSVLAIWVWKKMQDEDILKRAEEIKNKKI